MNYSKPELRKNGDDLPPVTVNFAPPAVGTSEEYKEKVSLMIEETCGTKPDYQDKRLSEAAKQI